ncbi:MAG: hypothetical protein JWN38_102 [Candidatus Saccharibacteria bacterium]|nr:hypothetical protein [Candidatus Saccharibacteria bacterium]
MVGGALAVNLAAALHGNTYEDIAAGVIGGGAAVAFKERIENARASLYYWTSKKLGTEPNPTDLD